MDFPVNLLSDKFVTDGLELNPTEFVSEFDEVRQDIYLLLKTHVGEFIQNPKLGSKYVVHTEDQVEFDDVQRTLEVLEGLLLEDVKAVDGEIRIKCTYNGDAREYSYIIRDLYE